MIKAVSFMNTLGITDVDEVELERLTLALLTSTRDAYPILFGSADLD
jgi:hypothetical protein